MVVLSTKVVLESEIESNKAQMENMVAKSQVTVYISIYVCITVVVVVW
jgi:hypothetical protein